MSIPRHHNEWLSLIEQSGPFLSVPVLMESDVFATGLDPHDPDLFRQLRVGYDEWRDQPHDLYGAWIEFILHEVLGFNDTVLRSGQSLPSHARARIAEHGESIIPDYALVNPDSDPHKGKLRLLIRTVPVGQDLDKPLRGKTWKASPNTRMVELLHGTDTPLGLVTNGEDWTLVHAPRGETSGFATWTADLWCEESITLRAFRSLLTFKRFFGVADENTIEKLYERSAQNQQEVTDQLGLQVRHAVEILVSRLDRLDQDNGRDLLRHVEEKRVYESALTVMMRLVFLMCAEERGLFPMDEPIYAQHYAVTTLRDALREVADKQGEEILERRHDAWVRLLALFRLIYGGSNDDRLRIVAYGGGLFDPNRFSFLEGRMPGTSWEDTAAHPLPIDNRTVLHLLEALQVLQINGEARRISFRALDIEQIGHVYEGLLDHTAIRALPESPVVGLQGTSKKEPEIELATLERKTGFQPVADSPEPPEALLNFLKEETGRSVSALRRALLQTWPTEDKHAGHGLEAHATGALLSACQGNDALYRRILPFAGLIRTDSFGNPVVIPGGAIYVTSGTDRRSTGTHYTPRSLTEPIVQYTLEPLVYTGPAEGLPKEEWRLRSPRELLDLKICDMAMGSGAFLVQACRYMSERLVESWEKEEARTGKPLTFPEADPATGKLTERVIPNDTNERLALARRAIAERCLYGVDKNPLAVEIAKLSLWLITLDKGRPFTFVDHALKAGDSLLGLHDPKQLENFHLDPKQGELLNYDFVHSSRVGVVREAMKKAADLRRQLEGFVVNCPRDAARKHELLREADEAIAILRTLADLIVGAQLQVFRKEFDGGYDDLIQQWMQEDVFYALDEGFDKETRAKHLANLEHHAREALANRDTFHWALEFPETAGTTGKLFHGIIGNPPFMGGTVATTAFGEDYMLHLHASNANWHGKADYVGLFVNHGMRLIKQDGKVGLVATSALIRGETAECTLKVILDSEGIIYRAKRPYLWPGSAAVAVVNLHLSAAPWLSQSNLDGIDVESIGCDLEPQTLRNASPNQLIHSPEAYLGIKIAPSNPIIGPTRHAELPRDVQSYFAPKLGGAELYGEAGSDRINYGLVPELIDDVSHERLRSSLGLDLSAEIIAHSAPAKQMRKRLGEEGIGWACGETTHCQLAFSKVGPEDKLLTHKTIVLIGGSWNLFAIVQSTFHVEWSWKWGIRMKLDLVYSPKRCAQTFAIPLIRDALDAIGERYHEHRRQVMLARQEGLTKTYNRFHKPEETSDDIQTLRDLHVEMDRAVLEAYRQSPGEAHIWEGFGPDDLEHGFHETKQGLRFTVSETARRELLDRLLELNHKRYAEEVAAGLHDKKKGKKREAGSVKRGAKKTKKAATPKVDPSDMFGEILEPVITSGALLHSPPKDRHQALMALLLHLVKHRPGLAEDQYHDAIGDAVRIQKNSGVLSDDQKDQVQEALSQIPELIFKQKPKVKFKHLWNSLQQLGYLRIRLEGATRHFEPREQELNKDHGWLVWPVENFAELVFAVGDAVDRDEDVAGDLVGRDLEGVEV